MSLNGTQYTFDPLTLSGLTLSNNLSGTYVPYSSANSTVNLNQQSLTNVKDITVGIPNDNANIYTTFINGSNFNIWTNKGTADELLMLNMQYIKDNVLGRYTNYFLYGRLWLYSGDGSTLWMANDSTGIMTFTQGVTIGSAYNINITPATSSTGTILTYGIGGATGNSSETLFIKNRSGVNSLYFAGDGTVKAVQNLNALKTLSVGAEIPAGNVTITGAGSTFAILQYGVGGTSGMLSDRLVIRNRAGTDVVLYTDAGNVFQYTGIFSCPSLAITGITNAFVYNNGSGTATAVQAIFASGNTSSANPNILLASGGAFQVSDAGNTQNYFLVENGRQRYAVNSGTYGYYTWVIDGLAVMSLNTALLNVLKPCTMTSLTINSSGCNLSVNGIASIYTGNRFMPTNGSYMSAGSLCIGSTNNSYGGNSGTSNIAGLILETQNKGNQEIAIHDNGNTVKSFMYYNGTNTKFYMGRDMGNGWGEADIVAVKSMSSRTFLLTGETGTYTNGCIYTDPNWGMLFRAYRAGAISSYVWTRYDGSATIMTLNNAGNLGIGVENASYKLDVRGNMAVNNGAGSTCLYGPNGYNSYLLVGAGTGGQETSSTTACIKSTNGNLHMDCAVGYYMYLNYYTAGAEILMFGTMRNTYSYNQFGGACTNNQPVAASFRQNVIGNWIGSRHDSTYATPYPDCVVIGTLGAQATIGAHNYNLTAWTTLYIANPSFTYPSDETIKENIVTANNELCYENIKRVRLVRYNYKEDGPAGELGKVDKSRLGVIAQEFQAIYPKSVSEIDDATTGKKYLTVDTQQLYYTLIGAVQQQQLLIEQQQKQIEEQKAQIASYEDRFKHYDELLDSMDQKFKRLGLKIQF